MKKTINTTALSIFAALCSVVLTVPAHADVVRFSNLNATTVDADPLATYGPIADSFSTTDYAATLNQVSLRLSGASDNGSVSVRLLSNASTAPGSVLTTIGTLSDSLLSSTLSNYTFTLATPFGLAANTRYWVQLTSNSSSANWAWSWDISGPGVASESIANINGVFANSSEGPYQMQVVTSTPEPSSFGILGLGLAGIVSIIRKKYTS